MDGIKWLFFDVGSTLVDESLAYEQRFRDIARLANVPFEQVWHDAMCFYRQNRKGDLEVARSLGVKVPSWHSECERPYPDAAECLAALHAKYRIGIIANQPVGTECRLARYGLLPYVDLVIASAEEGVSKPDPAIFELALQKSGCSPGQSMMIGDRIDNDIIPAKRLGMHTIWIRQGFGSYWNITDETENPDQTVSSLTGLLIL